MKFKTSQRGPVTVIELDGNLMGGPDATTLNTKLHELLSAGRKQVVIDLAGVEFMNSSGLGLLIGSAGAMKNVGGGLKLANASEKIAALITITKLAPVLELYPSLHAAMSSFKKQ